MFKCNEKRLEEKIKTFSTFGATGRGGITRLSLSPAALEARTEFCNRMKKMGAHIVTDDMANIYATIPGDEKLPWIMTGSHLDSVIQGGNYDGVLGVLTAMEAVETITTEKIPHRHPITVIVWTNEEGARFDPAMMSSGVITGKFEKEKMLQSKDTKGTAFKEALEASGYKGDIKNRMDPKNVKALFELHIEQGPVLDAEKKDIGIVEGVCGMVNYEFSFKGQADHAGTTPMSYRKDALFAASNAIIWLHNELDKLDSKLVYTTGRITCSPNIHTIIPDDVKFTLDARHQDPKVISQVVDIINKIPKEISKCEVSYEELWGRNTVVFNKNNVEAVAKAVDDLGYSSKRMYSGPGHDAQYAADVVPTSMIFVPSIDGHSHCEIEYTPVENCLKGANVLLNAILNIDAQ
ncbi:Zn-dependent hydrolase [Clostridium fermenticellae]|uniref:Zn-dependent hydrolase n=2 Tax=Clostridium TaxID=1485 RepID=A0ABS8N8B1_9CLOT|nr:MULTISPECIES: Zn-dependent hydrolase [Clostridium]AYD40491.1 Zn-dependent hydrolase [Clostridium fermenticellae]MCC9296061.1 Zn-dependent hydrolase [Clostridium aromativorans]